MLVYAYITWIRSEIELLMTQEFCKTDFSHVAAAKPFGAAIPNTQQHALR